MSIVFFVVIIANIFYLITNIRGRIKIDELNQKNYELEKEIEEALKKEKNVDINEIKQKVLERRIEAEIKENFSEAKIIKNAYIPKGKGEYSEIDLIAITRKGIFIIESKNVTGKITGNWKEEKLQISHPGGQTFDLYNPIIQNTGHFYALRNLLGMKNDLFRSVIVFGDKAYIQNFKNIPFYAQVCKVNNLIYSMDILFSRFKETLEDYQINNIYETIISFVEETEEKKEKHIERLEQSEEE